MAQQEVQKYEEQNTQQSNAMTEVASNRQMEEVKAAMVAAKRFPRDEISAVQKIKQSCKRHKLAENARYMYPRGGTQVTGPSIRLAEAMAQNWGNVDFGIIELEQKNGESSVMAYAWDLETNTRQTKVFQVPHLRYTKKGTYALTDPRDIYEMVANQGARRLRACILGIIPGDVVDVALEECEKTLKGSNEEPLVDRIKKMLDVFDKFGVNKQMIEKRLGHNLEATTEQEFVFLRDIYNSLKDGMAKREDYFYIGKPVEKEEAGKSMADKAKTKLAKDKKGNKPSEEEEGEGELPFNE